MAIKCSADRQGEALYCITKTSEQLGWLGRAHADATAEGRGAVLSSPSQQGRAGQQNTESPSAFWPIAQKRFTVIAGNAREFWTLNY